MQVRRVVTGHSAEGQAVVVGDDLVAPIEVGLLPGAQFHSIWGSDAPAGLPAPRARTDGRAWFPPAGGFRFGFVTFPPVADAAPPTLPLESAFAELREKLPGMLDVLEPDHAGMHTTDSVDFVVIVSGEIDLELDDGACVQLRSGDTVVQNGTRHAWHNRSASPCTVAVAIIGATRGE